LIKGETLSLQGVAQVIGWGSERRCLFDRCQDGPVEQRVPGRAGQLHLEDLSGPTDEDDHPGFEMQALLLRDGLRDVVVALNLRLEQAVVSLALLGRRVAVWIPIQLSLHLLDLLRSL